MDCSYNSSKNEANPQNAKDSVNQSTIVNNSDRNSFEVNAFDLRQIHMNTRKFL